MGVNLSALEWGETVIPGTYGTNYTSPTTAEVDYFTGKGMKIIRIPFLWERMQPTLMQPFNTTYRDRVESIVNYATSKAGVFAIVDCHNYHRYNGNIVGSTAVPVDSFVNLWTRIGARFATNPRVMFGLMNEPHDVPGGAAAVRDHQQAVIDALRAAGYGQYILVSGTQWSGGWTWTTSGNAAAMLSLTDPINRTIFDDHPQNTHRRRDHHRQQHDMQCGAYRCAGLDLGKPERAWDVLLGCRTMVVDQRPADDRADQWWRPAADGNPV